MFSAFMPQTQDPNVAGPTLEEMRKRKLMAELLQRKEKKLDIQHPLQGVAHILESAYDGFRDKRERQRSQAEATQANQMMAQFLAGSGGPTAPSAAPASPAPTAPSAPGTAPAAPSAAPRPVAFQGSQQDFVAQMMPHALRVSQQTGIDPRIVIAQSALESGWGRSAPGNNFFGIKSHGQPGGNTLATTEIVNGQPVRTQDSFRAYADMGESADGYARFLQQNPRYRPMLQAQGLDAQIQALGASGYATDPNYAAKIRSIAGGISLPQQRAEAPADTLTGSDGMEEPPLVDGRNLPPDTQAPALDRPAMSFDEAMPPPDPAPPSPIQAGPDPQAIAQALMAAPVPEPRPPTPAPSVDNMMAGDQVVPQGAPMRAPMPQPRPNLEPPPQAMPAGPAPQAPPPQAIAQALAPQMNERDRLMMLRDEQSLAPGEADRLRQGLPNPQAIAAVMQGRPLPQATPAPGPAQMPAQQPPQPQGMPQQMQAPQGAPQPMPQGGPAPQQPAPGQIPDQLLLRMMNNPQTRAFAMQEIQRRQQQNTPQAQAALAKAQADARIAQQQAEGNNPTDFERDFRNYEREERAAGRTPLSRFEFGQQRRRAAANSVNVNTTETGDNAFNTETAKKQAAMFDTLATDGLAARADAARIAELRRLGDRIGTGAGASLQAFAAQYGIKLGNNVNEVEAFQAIVNQLVPQQRPAGSGAMSDRDVQLFRDSLPSLVKTPGGNAIIFDTMQGIAEYRQQQAQIAARAQMGEIPRAQAIRELQALPDPLAAFRESRRAPPAASPPPAAPSAAPQVGEVRRGYRYKGGNPSQQSSWERAQ